MKRKTTKATVNTPVRKYLEQEYEPILPYNEVETEEQTKETEPYIIEQAIETVPGSLLVKCIWTGSIKVLADKTPTGTAYRFNPNEIKEVNYDDAMYLVSLGQNKPGCCSGSGTPRRYFELA